jgi:hypothetical protein
LRTDTGSHIIFVSAMKNKNHYSTCIVHFASKLRFQMWIFKYSWQRRVTGRWRTQTEDKNYSNIYIYIGLCYNATYIYNTYCWIMVFVFHSAHKYNMATSISSQLRLFYIRESQCQKCFSYIVASVVHKFLKLWIG